MIVEAEQMKAKLDAPQGRLPPSYQQMAYSDLVDDEFFHITCHVDYNIRNKTEQGLYVDVEKLLVKGKLFTKPGADNRMGLFTKDGVMYFVPTLERDTKNTNVRHWEQAPLHVKTA